MNKIIAANLKIKSIFERENVMINDGKEMINKYMEKEKKLPEMLSTTNEIEKNLSFVNNSLVNVLEQRIELLAKEDEMVTFIVGLDNESEEIFSTTKEVLLKFPDSKLAKNFFLREEKEGFVTFKRDCKLFSCVLNYVRDGDLIYFKELNEEERKKVKEEFDFFEIKVIDSFFDDEN